jgi:hypothetical protein
VKKKKDLCREIEFVFLIATENILRISGESHGRQLEMRRPQELMVLLSQFFCEMIVSSACPSTVEQVPR